MPANSSKIPRFRRSPGFTLVELIIALGVIALVIGGSFQAIVQFRKAFDTGEQSSEMVREATRFVEYLRKDLHNAVPTIEIPGTTFRQEMKCTADELSFAAFQDDDGKMAPITYTLVGKSIQRSVAGGTPQTLITDSVASLSWTLNEDGANRSSSFQAGRIWIHLEALFGKPDAQGKLLKTFRISTNLFPVPWNRMVQRNPKVN